MTTPVSDLQRQLRPEAERIPVLREYLRCSREQVRTLHEEGGSGQAVAAAWTQRCDTLVRALFEVLLEPLPACRGKVALVALGEFGRRTLSPYTAMDLLLVHQEGFAAGSLMEGLLYPLWDSRLDVHGVARTPRENREVAAGDPRSLANLAEARLLCGDLELARSTEVWDLVPLPGHAPEMTAALAAEMSERHARYGGTVYLLEPQLVEGQGGLRDIQAGLWAVLSRFGARTVDQLGRDGLVPSTEIQALHECRSFLLRLRNHLHLQCGRREDRLSFELQDDAAPFFGYADTALHSGAEGLLQEYYACANQVGHLVESLLRRATNAAGGDVGGPAEPPASELGPGLALRAGEILLDAQVVATDPLVMLAAFEASQTHDADLSPQALQVIRDNLGNIDDRCRRDPDAVAAFLRVLQHPRRVASTLLRMHDVRFLDHFIPELEQTFGLVQRDPYHAYPVDVHSLFAVQELRRLARGEYRKEFPHYTSVMEELELPHLVYLAALLHDAGKGHGSRHEERGAELAIQVADRMDLPPRERAYLEFLVREHLSLALTAQSRDLHDEQLITEFAGRIGDPQLLRMLHLLTFADVRAVGPTAWTGWKHQLYRALYEKARAILEGGLPQRDLTGDRVEAARRRLREAANDLAPPDELEAFLTHIDHPRYLIANPVEVLLRHLAAFLKRGEAPVVQLRAVPAEGFTEVVVLSKDRPGLFATVAGLFASHQINILSAVLNTRTDGWVLDVFHVTVPRGEPLERGPRWDRWREGLISTLAGNGALPPLEHRQLQGLTSRQPALPPVPTRVSVDNRASSRFTVVDLSGPDRLGLLYDVSRALAEQGLTVRLAKIVTMIRRVADSFYVETVDGGKLTDPSRIAELERRLESVVAGDQEEGVPG